MKKSILVSLILMIFATAAMAGGKNENIVIKSSVVCGMCKDRVEQGLAFEKGIKNVVVDLDKKTVTVIYNPSKTNAADIKDKISKLGYDADEVAADKTAYDKLPPCCRKENAKH